MSLPFVSCIMPTRNRSELLTIAIETFLKQDYPKLELIIHDDSDESLINLVPSSSIIRYYYSNSPRSVGLKRNFACKKAIGEIIIHLDDDDWYASNWVSRQVTELLNSGADICGINQLLFYAVHLDKSWQYTDSNIGKPWIYGATFAYWRTFWEEHPFKDIQAGEDNDFIWNNDAVIHSYKYIEGYIGVIHSDNIAMVPFENPKEKIQVIKWMKTFKQPEICTNISILEDKDYSLMVTCIMPTANRRKFIPTAIQYFISQDYPNKELIIIDDGSDPIEDLVPLHKNISYFYSPIKETIGEKRNFACKKAIGGIIVHWDDDDWYATNWLSYQVQILQNNNADICGLNQIQFYSILDNKYWMTKNMNSKKLWLSGATLAYHKTFWEKHPFNNLQIGEDDDFVRNNGAKLFAHNYYQGFIAIIHPKNTSIKVFQ